MSRAMPPPLTVLERGFLRWPRHVTRLDFRRHQQVTRYVLKGWNGPTLQQKLTVGAALEPL
jgi:hypothetical protein